MLARKGTVHVHYTFSIHPVHVLCTGRVQAVDGPVHARGQSWCVRNPYTISTHPYTSCVQAVDGQYTGQYTRPILVCKEPVHDQYTSVHIRTSLVYRPWTGRIRVSTQGFLCRVSLSKIVLKLGI